MDIIDKLQENMFVFSVINQVEKECCKNIGKQNSEATLNMLNNKIKNLTNDFFIEYGTTFPVVIGNTNNIITVKIND